MIYPTRLSILLAAAVAPVALMLGILQPAAWAGGLALLGLLLIGCAVDALAGAAPWDAEVELAAPGSIAVGETIRIDVRPLFRGAAPRAAEIALGLKGPATPSGGWRRRVVIDAGSGVAAFGFLAHRRGTIRLEAMWIRWTGRLGLVWKQKRSSLDRSILVTPDLRPVRDRSAQMINRDAIHGQAAQLRPGEGAEFESLTDYRPGMDRRAIDWKQSARHTALVAKEFRTERNNQIVLAIDCGRAMSEPSCGAPRVDRAVSAALLTAFVALRDGDRVGLFAFDSRPRASSRPISGPNAFAMLQRVAASIEYGARETNYTLALAALAGTLARRSLLVVFTEFTDTISAELMLAALAPLLKRHLVLFVVLRDTELESFTAAEPKHPSDLGRAVIAAGLLQERELVLARLRHLGVDVIEAAPDAAGPALVSAYLSLKRRNRL